MILRTFFAVIFLLSLSVAADAQTMQDVMLSGDQQPVAVTEKMPVYPGGQDEMMKYLSKNITYPPSAVENNLQGVVYVQFVVDTDGSIINAKVLRGFYPDCDAEALRVVNTMPAWTPGEQDGKKVKVLYNLPIRFALN